MRYCFLSFLFFFCTNLAQAQITLDSLLSEHWMEAHQDNALVYALESFDKAKNTQPDSILFKYRTVLGKIYLETKQYPDALLSFQAARTLAEQVYSKNSLAYVQATCNLAQCHKNLKELKKAEEMYTAAVKSYETLTPEDLTKQIDLYKILSTLNLELNQYKRAEFFHIKIKNIYQTRSSADTSTQKVHLHRYTRFLISLGQFYEKIERNEEARLTYNESKSLIEQNFGKKSPNYAAAINNLAELYRKSGSLDKAEPLYLEASDIALKQMGPASIEYAGSLNNLAVLYGQQDKNVEAIPLLLKILPIVENWGGKAHYVYTSTLSNLAYAYQHTGKLKKAHKTMLQTLAIQDKYLPIESQYRLITLDNLTHLHNSTGALDSALYYCLLSISGNSPSIEVTQTIDLDFIQKIPTFDYTSNQMILTTFKHLYKLLIAKKEQDLAYELIKSVLKLNEKFKNTLLSSENKLRILKENIFFSSLGIELALQANKPAEAFKFAEQNKSILLSSALKTQEAQTFGLLPDSLVKYEKQLYQELGELKSQLITTSDQQKKASIYNQINTKNYSIEQFEARIQKNFPKYYEQKYKPLDIKSEDVQNMLNDSSLLIEFYIAENLLYTIIIDHQNCHLHKSKIANDSLKLLVKQFRTGLSDYSFIFSKKAEAYQLYTKTAFLLYQQLIAPIQHHLEGKTELIIIPDGDLGHLPFEALLTKDYSDKSRSTPYQKLPYLLQKFSISYSYSSLLLLENKKQVQAQNSKQLLAFSAHYPQFKESDLGHLTESQIKNRMQLKGLPAAIKEVENLEHFFEAAHCYYKNEATEANFKKTVGDYSIIHLAMHGILNQEYPLLSALVFTETLEGSEDNFLQAYEISKLQLNSNLVVLSACETGYGRFEQGEGVLSLARSFMYAGVPSLVVSLWQVNDGSTAIVMKSFYQHLAQGKYKDKALQQAKLDYLDLAQDLAAHPAFWSPFIQLGDNRPIPLLTEKKTWFWPFLIGILLLGGLFLYRTFRMN